MSERPLTYDELRVRDMVLHSETPVSVEQLSAALRLSPDEVVKAAAILLERHLIKVFEPDEAATQELELVAVAR